MFISKPNKQDKSIRDWEYTMDEESNEHNNIDEKTCIEREPYVEE